MQAVSCFNSLIIDYALGSFCINIKAGHILILTFVFNGFYFSVVLPPKMLLCTKSAVPLLSISGISVIKRWGEVSQQLQEASNNARTSGESAAQKKNPQQPLNNCLVMTGLIQKGIYSPAIPCSLSGFIANPE